MQTHKPNNAATTEFVIARLLDAPRERVWSAWTERDQLMQWFGPKGVTIAHAELDLCVGGVFHYAMRTPVGADMWGKWQFREIEAPQRLVLVTTFSDAQGGITRHPFAPTWPAQTLSTSTFEQQGEQTLLTIRCSPLDASELEQATFDAAHAGMLMGWGGTFEQLTAFLAKA